MHIHITGIAGSLLAPLAIELKKQGHTVTGSDKAFYPPASTILEKAKIKIIPGFKPDKFEKIGLPDLVVMMGFLTPKNPEILFLKEKKVRIIGLGQLLEEHFIKENSVVVTGSAGKTTTSSMVAWILHVKGLDPSLLIGGAVRNFKNGVRVGKSSWTVSEGDEFKNWHITKNYSFTKKSRIFYQKPKYVIFSGAEWDHHDIYPTKKEYYDNFKKFTAKIPSNGIFIGNADGKKVLEISKSAKCPTIFYGMYKNEKISQKSIYYYPKNIKYANNGSTFEIIKIQNNTEENLGEINIQMLGNVNVENAIASIAMSDQLGIDWKNIKKAIESYIGVKRRQEIRLDTKKYVVYDDFAHSPVKVRQMLSSFKKHYQKNKVIVIYQPGSKDDKSIKEYTEKEFSDADLIILPHISSITKKSREFNKKIEKRLKSFKDLKNKVLYIENDEEVVQKLKKEIDKLHKKNKKKVVVIFAGQKGFRGMIEEMVK